MHGGSWGLAGCAAQCIAGIPQHTGCWEDKKAIWEWVAGFDSAAQVRFCEEVAGWAKQMQDRKLTVYEGALYEAVRCSYVDFHGLDPSEETLQEEFVKALREEDAHLVKGGKASCGF